MTDSFTLTIQYKGEEREFTAQLLLQGYTHKFKVLIDQMEVFFEADEEGAYRAVKMPWQREKDLDKIDKGLLSEIQHKIAAILE